MSKVKLKRFAENATFPHLFQPDYYALQEGFPLKGKWNTDFFMNQNPLILEIGCGKGEYTVSLARENPGINYIGIDRKGARMWRGAKTSQTENLCNVAFIRMLADHLDKVFSPDEVSEIWLTFPDPQLGKKARQKKRLTSPVFLARYRQYLKPGGIINLKTDDDTLYAYTLEIIREMNLPIYYNTADLYDGNTANDATRIQTFYESIHLAKGLKIKYLRFGIEPQIP